MYGRLSTHAVVGAPVLNKYTGHSSLQDEKRHLSTEHEAQCLCSQQGTCAEQGDQP